MLRFHNTLTGQAEEFRPMREGEVRIYICGPTVWDYAHIGNFRTLGIFADTLRRYLKHKGYRVTAVMNITDIEDRIIDLSQKQGVTIAEYTARYAQAFWEDYESLGCVLPEVTPRATGHVAEMVEIIARLVEKGHAYESGGSYYYRISSFLDYGKLSKINFEGNIVGASERVDTDKYDKEDARDFALWKAAESEDEPAWDTPLGRGRPGWHIECSAMSMKYLGESFDIHAGGIDLVFPHHENEIAQSEGATGVKPFARYWLHAEHLKVEGETMSKTKGNYYTFRDLVRLGHDPVAVRYLMLSVPYRKQLNFTMEALSGAKKTVQSLRDFRTRLAETRTEAGTNPSMRSAAARALEEFEAGLDDDLNTSVALAAVHNLSREVNRAIDCHELREDDRRDLLDLVARFDAVFNIFGADAREILDDEVQARIRERQEARRRRDFSRADEVRAELYEDGVILEDTKEGVRWKDIRNEIQASENVVRRLLGRFKGQRVPSELFGQEGEITLPVFDDGEIYREPNLTDIRPDFYVKGANENWIVEVKAKYVPERTMHMLEQAKAFAEYVEEAKIWLVIMNEITQTQRERLSSMNILVSTISDIKKLEELLT